MNYLIPNAKNICFKSDVFACICEIVSSKRMDRLRCDFSLKAYVIYEYMVLSYDFEG